MKKTYNLIRTFYRLIICAAFILSFLVWSFICHFVIREPNRRKAQFTQNSHFFVKLLVKVFNFELSVVNKPADDDKFLAVSNHMGFVDILLISSIFPTVFVTSVEMRETPVLGLLTEMGGCVYVERRNRAKISEELHSLVAALKKGFRIVLYPEATSTNGEQVLPFKRTLMMASAYAGVPIQPIVVNFREVNGEQFSLKWRDHVCWYGDIPFAVSMWNMLSLDSLKAEVEFLDRIHATPEDDRAAVADKAHSMISEKFVPVVLS